MLAAVALLAGALQLMATVKLGLAELPELQQASAQSARLYLIGAVGVVAALSVAWLLRRRPLWALGTLVVWLTAMLWPLSRYTDGLGLAFHGEYVLHHFSGLLAAAVIVAIGTSWLRTRALGLIRLAPALLVLVGVALLLAAHVLEQPSLTTTVPPWLERVGAGVLLLGWAASVPALWNHLGPERLRWIAAVLVLPFLIRIAFAWPEGLSGASVTDAGRPVLMLSMIAAAVITFFTFRPPIEMGLRSLVWVFSGVVTMMLYVYCYRAKFGELEAGLGGLAQSMFAFSLPYPNYVPIWKALPVALGLFAMFSAAYGGLLSPGNRSRGVALSLMVVAGLGLSTPPLVMMTAAAGLVWVDSLLADGHGPSAYRGPAQAMATVLERVTERLGTPALVTLGDGAGALLAVRGELHGRPIDLRARPRPGDRWEVTLTVGVLGRGRPMLSLLPEPGDEGHRPAHLVGRSHRAHGQVRQIELLDDSLFDALMPFPRAQLDLWDAGARVRFGVDLRRFDDDRVAELVRQLATIE